MVQLFRWVTKGTRNRDTFVQLGLWQPDQPHPHQGFGSTWQSSHQRLAAFASTMLRMPGSCLGQSVPPVNIYIMLIIGN